MECVVSIVAEFARSVNLTASFILSVFDLGSGLAEVVVLLRSGVLVPEPWEENGSLGLVLGPLWVLASFSLKKGHSRDVAKQERNHQWTEDSDPAFWHPKRDNEEAPPEKSFTEVVRMPCVAPKTCLAEFAFIGVRVCYMLRQLSISNNFKEEADEESTEAYIVRPLE